MFVNLVLYLVDKFFHLVFFQLYSFIFQKLGYPATSIFTFLRCHKKTYGCACYGSANH